MHQPKNKYRTIALAGLLAGTLDISAALIRFVIVNGKNPVIVLRFIASGVLGQSAFSGGAPVAILGLALHFFVAYSFTLFFFFIYPRMNFLSKNKLVSSLLYGIFIWLVMNLIAVPLSNTPKFPFKPAGVAIDILILAFAIGLPLSLIAGNYYREINQTPSSK